jgi:predicted nucleotidyltransferase
MKKEILAAVKDIERTHGVRVLLAVESGSRAWGFASPDSDYDVRFIYVHPRDWYLSVFDARDVIEKMLPGDLDVSGWELRKALRLFSKCNLALNEWLGSPIRYADEPGFRESLSALVPNYFNPIAGLHHYRRMAAAALEENVRDGAIGIKKLFYVLRPLLSCRWITHARMQPPTEFARLVASEWVTVEERAWIADLLERKARAAEAHAIPVDSSRLAALRSEIADHEAAAAHMSFQKPENDAVLDEILRRWVV